jgi:polyphosphate kinase
MPNLNDPKNYINRELSWLRFNTRVLNESMKKELPLLERLKFLAIYTTNLDEFYMIRVAGLKQLFSAGVIVTGSDQMTPLDQLREIRRYISEEKKVLQNNYKTIMSELEKENLFVINYSDLKRDLKRVFPFLYTSSYIP